jgi:hypothetical protein
MNEPGYSPQSVTLSRENNEFHAAWLSKAESKPKQEHKMNHSAITCCVEILLVLFWLKGRGKLDGFSAPGAFGLDGLVVWILKA